MFENKRGGDNVLDKKVEALVKLRDALRMASDALDDYINSFAPKFMWNPDKIKWVQAEGASGPYERSEDVDNPEFKLMMKDLTEHKGKFRRGDYFYWAFQRANVVGRKKVK